MIHVDLLEQFLLRFGLQITDNGLGRPTTITQLWLGAKEACGECDCSSSAPMRVRRCVG